MNESIFNAFNIIKNVVYFITFLVSLNLIKNKNIPTYMRGFYWYPIIANLMLFIHILEKDLNLIPKEFFRDLNLVSLLFHFTFLCLFIFKVIPKSNDIKYLKLVFFIFFPLITFFIVTDIIHDEVLAFAVTNFGLIILCISYYYQLFKTTPSLNLLKDPSFWIITGILFGMSTTIPVSIIGGYLFHNIPRDIFLSVAVIMPLGYGIMHLFFLKAILCSIRRQKVL